MDCRGRYGNGLGTDADLVCCFVAGAGKILLSRMWSGQGAGKSKVGKARGGIQTSLKKGDVAVRDDDGWYGQDK